MIKSRITKLFFLLFSFIIIGCTISKSNETKYVVDNIENVKDDLTKQEKYNWQYKDVFEDSIAGISLNKAYRELLINKHCDTIIVAVLDTGIDINHIDLKNIFWKNSNEIGDNNLDDDNNGYVDDVHGWNFLGNEKGINVQVSNYESTRFVRLYDTLFKNKSIQDFKGKDTLKFKQYKKALKDYESKYEKAKKALEKYAFALKQYDKMIASLRPYFPNKNFTIEKLNAISVDDDSLKYFIEQMKLCITNELKRNFFEDKEKWARVRFEQHLGASGYNESSIIGDNPNTLSDKGYGNNDVEGDSLTRYHGTQVTGVLAGNRINNQGIKGVTNCIKIMPLRIAALGSERDKDIALAIYYAVDNGAKVINMSFRNDFSIHREWVDEAIKYAASKDVVIAVAAGNESLDSDIYFNYPNDQIENGSNFVNNLIVVGASSYTKNIISDFSNYGKNNVDIFAPGENIHTTTPNNKHLFIDGTSIATPIVSGIAALIRSYYPNLNAAEVKEIIMESGVSYDIMVKKPSTNEEKELVPFSSLSKSGKIVNAYNALLLAEQISKKK
ncbi:MAG: S8 family serine peptidase [Bacteroidota bacterium]